MLYCLQIQRLAACINLFTAAFRVFNRRKGSRAKPYTFRYRSPMSIHAPFTLFMNSIAYSCMRKTKYSCLSDVSLTLTSMLRLSDASRNSSGYSVTEIAKVAGDSRVCYDWSVASEENTMTHPRPRCYSLSFRA